MDCRDILFPLLYSLVLSEIDLHDKNLFYCVGKEKFARFSACRSAYQRASNFYYSPELAPPFESFQLKAFYCVFVKPIPQCTVLFQF